MENNNMINIPSIYDEKDHNSNLFYHTNDMMIYPPCIPEETKTLIDIESMDFLPYYIFLIYNIK